MDIVVPEVGESVFEATVAKWHVKDGSQVAKEDLLCELETDKISLELHAEQDGVITLQAKEGQTVKVGAVIATLKEGAETERKAADEDRKEGLATKKDDQGKKELKANGEEKEEKTTQKEALGETEREKPKEEKQPSATGKTPEKTEDKHKEPPSKTAKLEKEGLITRVAMSPIRKKIAAHLLAARQQTAMLTTFNEADLSRLLALRKKKQEAFQKKHDVKLGLMSFFVRASILALREYEAVNAQIDGDDILYHHHYDIGVAIGGEKGLVVPVIRDADQLNYAGIEKAIQNYAEKVQKNKIELSDLEGGTFTISNGGVYGSLLSTPILNPPQCAVLGMHAIQDRVVAVDGKMEIRPMMYLALSYDHRLIDGRQAVGFLKKIKEFAENPDEELLDL